MEKGGKRRDTGTWISIGGGIISISEGEVLVWMGRRRAGCWVCVFKGIFDRLFRLWILFARIYGGTRNTGK